MSRAVWITCGVGLIVLWLAAVGDPGLDATIDLPHTRRAMLALAWTDLALGLVCFAVAAVKAPAQRKGKRLPPLLMGLALCGVWVAGLVLRVIPWLNWGNFAFACGQFLLIATPHAKSLLEYRAAQGPYVGVGPRNYKRSDRRIEEDVNEALTRHHGIDATDIAVSVKEGEVTLMGSVDSRHAKRLAEAIAERAPGVVDVHNYLEIQGLHSA